jgi:cyclin B
MESKILSAMEFNLAHTSSLRFLERQITGANLCERVSNTARMIAELSLIDGKQLRFAPSLQATTAVLLGINLLNSP